MPDRTPQKKFKTSEPPKLYTDSEEPDLVEVPDLVTLDPGSVIDGKYKVISCIGKGEIAVVYRVEHVTKQKEYALKLFADEFSESQIQRFQTDAKAASLLEHQNTAKLVDFGVIEGKQPYCVSELLSGISLADYLHRCGRLTYDDIFNVFLPLSWALQDAHEKGVVHRNVKPSNILLIGEQGNWECKLLDFGTGKLSEGCRKSKSSFVRASADPHYMSPEQCSGKRLDARSDIYSLGCALFEAITAQPPYSAEDSEAVRKMHFNAPLPTLREASLGREFPQLLEGIVHTMLAKEPQHRYSSASQVAENLMRLKLSAQLKIRVLPKTQPPKIPQDKVIFVLFITSIVAIGMATYFWTQLPTPIATKRLQALPVTFGEPKTLEELAPEDINAVPTIENVNAFTPDRSTKAFFQKSRTVDGIEFREYQFPAVRVGSLKDPKSGVIEAIGKQEVAWSGPWVFKAADSLFQVCPTVLRRFRDNEIRAIDFASNVNSTEFQKLGRFKMLDELSFEASRFDDSRMKDIARLSNLKTLSLRRTNVTAAGLSCFPGLGKLRKLALEGMPNVILVLHALQKSDNLEELQLRNCPGLTEDHYKSIAAIPNLKRLSISRFDKIDPSMFDALANSKSLVELDVQDTALSQADVEGMAKLHRLKKFAYENSSPFYKARFLMKKLMPMTEVERYDDFKAYWNGY